MHWFLGTTAVLTLLFTGVVGYYLLLVAKFYRIKFSRGPKPYWMQMGFALLLLGLILRLPWLGFLPPFIWQATLSLGGLIFAAFTYMLYRSMMSPH
jgi:hypothetical protein